MKTAVVLSDHERRVLANLSQPTSLPNLARLIWSDRHATFQKKSVSALANLIAHELGVLQEAGLAVNIGINTDVEDLVKQVKVDDRVPTLHPEKAEQFVDRMSGKDSYKLNEGALWYWTEAGREILTTT